MWLALRLYLAELGRAYRRQMVCLFLWVEPRSWLSSGLSHWGVCLSACRKSACGGLSEGGVCWSSLWNSGRERGGQLRLEFNLVLGQTEHVLVLLREVNKVVFSPVRTRGT